MIKLVLDENVKIHALGCVAITPIVKPSTIVQFAHAFQDILEIHFPNAIKYQVHTVIFYLLLTHKTL